MRVEIQPGLEEFLLPPRERPADVFHVGSVRRHLRPMGIIEIAGKLALDQVDSSVGAAVRITRDSRVPALWVQRVSHSSLR